MTYTVKCRDIQSIFICGAVTSDVYLNLVRDDVVPLLQVYGNTVKYVQV